MADESEQYPWEQNGDLPWETSEAPGEWLGDTEAWRGDVHASDWATAGDAWPEDLAGPEYWLFKHDDDDTV